MGWSSPASRRVRERLSGTPRLVLAVVLLAAGVLVALTATAPPAAGPVVVAVREVQPGATVTAADVAVAQRAVADRPDGALTTVAPAVGRRAVGALTRGEVVTSSRLAPTGLSRGLAAGRSLATVSVATSRAGVITVGDVVRVVSSENASTETDILGSDPSEGASAPVTLADDARVLALWPGGDDGSAVTVVLDVDVGSASRLAVLPGDLLVGLVIVTA